MSADAERQKRSSDNGIVIDENSRENTMYNDHLDKHHSYSSANPSEERNSRSNKERRSSKDRDDGENRNVRSRDEFSDSRGDSADRSRSSRSKGKNSDLINHCNAPRRASRSRSRDRASVNHSSSDSSHRQPFDVSVTANSDKAFDDEAPKRSRRTGWDTTGSAAAPSTVSGPSFTQLSPTSTGFTASLTGRTPEQIQAELAERQAQAAAVATSMQAKASLHQLCRIYVGSLDYSLSDTDIRQVFSAFGPIVNIDMPKEGNRSKGFCFVEYTTPESADMALQTMVGFNLKGRSIKVGRPTALGGQQPLGSVTAAPSVPQLSSSAAALKAGGLNAAEAGQMAAAMLLGRAEGIGGYDAQNRVYVGSVPYTFTAEDIKQIFDVFGSILSCQLIPSNERPGTHRGYGFIEYATHEQAKLAIETMNDFPVAGKLLKVNYATALRGPTGLPLECPPAPTINSIPPIPSAAATGANALPVVLPLSVQQPPAPAAVRPPPMSGPSPILLLCNMVDPEEANEEVKEEIQAECGKYGSISQIKIVVDDQQKHVRIFIAFSSPMECSVALPALHDRWFGGRKITACYYDPDAFAKGQYWKLA